MRYLALILTGLLVLPLTASAAPSQNVTVNLCNEYPYVVAGGVNLNALVRPLCKPGQVVPFTLDLCKSEPRLYGFGGHDKNAFTQATGLCN